ncbi:MAG: ABC-F family ATP-binding cassette domain-containing protein [candidate division WOR-3 bacterium]|nr:MAG: ABC-F family ATP-binding cassette domain-containing protein [candidate division WOR-3 bacterium]
MIQATNLCKAFGAEPVLNSVSMTLNRGEKVGLVGPNGCGKTTLLRILLRELAPDSGRVVVDGSPEMAYVRQDVLAEDGVSVYDWVFGELDALEHRIEKSRQDLASDPDDEGEMLKLEILEEEMETKFGADFRSRGETALDRFGFGADRRRDEVQRMSPGERARLELARVVTAAPEVLLLDEPTNFLDVAQREWLEDYLRRFPGTVLAVSHDRVFLNRIVNRVYELRRGKLQAFEGDYDDYARARQHQLKRLQVESDLQQKELRRLRQVAEKRKAWAGRREKDKRGAGDKGFVTARAARMAKRAKHAEKRIEQALERHEAARPFTEKKPRLRLFSKEPPNKRALLARSVHKSFGGRTILNAVSFELKARERAALVGANGCGKTVLLKMLAGELKPDKGQVGTGTGLKFGWFPQDLASLDLSATPLEEVMRAGATEQLARLVLGTLLLREDLVDRPLSEVSAGERSKALLARILASGADFLVLDEPTNHLDIEALLALEGLLSAFPGGMILATHDRRMLERLADRVLELRDGNLTDYPGTYRSFRQKQNG